MNVSKAFRRGSVRLKSFSCGGHSDLNLIISDIREARSAAKHFADAQETVWKDLSKWASKERNKAIKESFTCLSELSRLWTEVQSDFIDQLNKFKYSFEMILEGETSVDKLRERLSHYEGKQTRLLKEEKKARKKRNYDKNEVSNIQKNIVDTRSLIKTTITEICEKTHENEAVKVIRVKEGLLKISDSYLDLAHKSNLIFDGTRSIASSLPAMDPTCGVHDVRYQGLDSAKQKLARIKEAVKSYGQRPQLQPGAPPTSESSVESPPPPYTHLFNNHIYLNPRLSHSGEVNYFRQQDLAGSSWR